MQQQQLTSFEETILNYLKELSERDQQLKDGLANPNKTITECAKYIAHWVQKQTRLVFTNDEIYGLAIHYFTEESLKVDQFDGKFEVKMSKDKLSEADIEAIRRDAREQIFREEKEKLTAKKQKASQPDREQQAEFEL